jgi:ADP-ribosyl-[dinitrogen reductase] hydrolase
MTALPIDEGRLRDRFRGTLLGHATGDALGAPADFLTAEQIEERYGVITEMLGGGWHELQPGQVTDATEMMLSLAESLAEIGEFEPEDIMARYLAWFEGAPCDVSLTVRAVLLSYRSGTHWDVASRRGFEILGSPRAGNGSLMRCSPVALRYWRDAAMRRQVSQRESTLTHFDHLAGWACVAFNDLLAAALIGELTEQLPAIAATIDEEDRRVSATLRDAVEAEPEEIQSSAFVLDTLRTALWAVLHTGTFEEAVCLAVSFGNDADTVGAVVGALAGAVYGEAGIPPRWLAPLSAHRRVATVADRLADLALADLTPSIGGTT